MSSAEAERVGCPKEVDAAFKLSVAAVALEVAAWVLGSFVISPTGLEEMRRESGESGAIGQLALSGAVMAVISALWLFVAFKMRAGLNWARLVFVAVSALSVFFQLNSLSMNGFQWTSDTIVNDLLLGGLPSVLSVGAAVLLLLPASNAYFSGAARAVR